MNRRRDRARLKLIVRLLVGAGLIAFLLLRTNTGDVVETIRGADPLDLILGILAVFLGVAVGGLRWRAFLEELGLEVSPWTAVRLTIVGSFFNAFLPTGFGGDAYKAVRLRGEPGALGRAAASVLLDRWVGIVGMAIVGMVGPAIRLAQGDDSRPVLVGLLLGLGVLVASIGVLTIGPRFLRRSQGSKSSAGLKGRLARLVASIVTTGRHPRAARAGLTLGLVTAGFVLLGHAFLTAALDIDIPLGALAGIMLIGALITIIPVTVNGLGLREASYVWSLGVYGVAHDEALAFGLIMLAAILASSLVGGIIYLLGGAELRDDRSSTLEGCSGVV